MKSLISWTPRNGDRASEFLIPLREVAGWEYDLHAAMNNIQESG